MTALWASVLVAAVLAWLAGSRWACRKFARACSDMAEALDRLEATALSDSPRIRPGRIPGPDRLDLEAQAAYRGGLSAWDRAATDRLLEAVLRPQLCESCDTNLAAFCITWLADGRSHLVCKLCASLVPADGSAEIEAL